MVQHDPKVLQSILAASAPCPNSLAFRPMFGGIMGYAHGKPFASLSNVGLALKLGKMERAGLLAVPGARPLQYDIDSKPSKTYVVVPEAMLDDVNALSFWTKHAIDFVTGSSMST